MMIDIDLIELHARRERMAASLKRLQQLQLQMYGEIAQNPEAPASVKSDALHHIAMLSGAIDSFVDSNGREHRRAPDDWMLTVAMLSRWEAEDGASYLPEGLPCLRQVIVRKPLKESKLQARAIKRAQEHARNSSSRTGSGKAARTRHSRS